MTQAPVPEVWLRGAVDGVPPLLQPVAHALLQAREEVRALMHDFPDSLLHERPAGVASPAFHLRHIPGVLDRLSTYALGNALSPAQLTSMRAEGASPAEGALPESADDLVEALSTQVDRTIALLHNTPEHSLTERRTVGRAQLPSTVLGLLSHAAEHTMRHVGQLHVTVRVLNAGHARADATK